MESIIETLIEVELKEPDDFLKVRETLTRIGICSPREKRLYQSCHILHKRGKYYIVHFKELFALDGKRTNFSEEDEGRRNTIARLLCDWDLIDIVDESKVKYPLAPITQVKIIPFRDKQNWELISKYTIGGNK